MKYRIHRGVNLLFGLMGLLLVVRETIATDRFVGDTAVFTQSRSFVADVLLLIDVGKISDAEDGLPFPSVRQAVVQMVRQQRDRARFGVMVFGGSGHGGRLIYPLNDLANEANFRLFTDALAALTASESATANADLSLAEALIDGQAYFDKDRITDIAPMSGEALPASPMEVDCRKNFMIVVAPGGETKGSSSAETDQAPSPDKDPDGMFAVDAADRAYLDDLSEALAGRQNIRTQVVATEQSTWLPAVAEAGRGLYRQGRDAPEITAALTEMLDNLVLEAGGSFTPPVNSSGASNPHQGLARIYLGFFQPRSHRPWLGNLKKYAVDDKNRIMDSSGRLALCPDPGDHAGGCAQVADGGFKPNTRSYWSSRADGGNVVQGGAGEMLLTTAGSERRIYSNLSDQPDLAHPDNAVSLANLGPERLRVKDSATAEKLIAYLRGYDAYDEDEDGVTTEVRPWVLGEILHSRPAVVHYHQYPFSPEAESDPRINRSVVFVGGNDGMLHAFRDADGRELWAFVPDALLAELHGLSGTGHGYYVDGPVLTYVYDRDGDGNVGPGPERADDDFDPPGIIDDGADDRVILLFGLRRGGNAYYALDVTVPTEPQLLWKFDAATVDEDGRPLFPELGQTWSEPQLARMRINGIDQLVAFIGAGYDVAEDGRFGATAKFSAVSGGQVGAGALTSDEALDANQAPMSGRGLYAFALARFDGRGIPQIAEVPRRIWGYTTANNARLDRAIPAALTVLDGDADGYADRLYAADLGGRLWRFTVKDGSPAKWSGEMIFSPPDHAGRKVFYRPSVVRSGSQWLVAYGTGDRAHPLNTAVTDKFYLIKDLDQTTTSAVDESDLVDITADLLQHADTNETERQKLLQELNSKTCYGWLLTLNRLNQDGQPGGEKVLSAPVIFNQVVYFTTYMPDAPSALSTQPCAVGNPGTARLYALDYLTGEAVLNFCEANDATETEADDSEAAEPLTQTQEILCREDRDRVLGTGLPAGLVVLFSPGGEAGLLVGAEGRLLGMQTTAGGVIYPLYWKEW